MPNGGTTAITAGHSVEKVPTDLPDPSVGLPKGGDDDGSRHVPGVVDMNGWILLVLNLFYRGGLPDWWNITFYADWYAWENLVIHFELTF